MVVILDIECNWINKKMIPKELAFIDSNNPLELKHYIIKPTIPWESVLEDDKNRNYYCFHNLHHISYEAGDVEINELEGLINKNTNIIVSGYEKTKLVQSLIPHCKVQDCNIRNLNKFTLPYSHIKCPYSNHSTNHCAVSKVYKIYHLNSLYHGTAKWRNFLPIQ